MLRISSKDELLNSFRELDRPEVILPNKLEFPLAVIDYFSWVEASGARVYMLFKDRVSGQPLGLVFRRTAVSAEGKARMCDWCHSVRGPNEIGLLSVAASRKQRVGLSLCRDLGCKNRILQPPHTYDLRESLAREEKLMRVLDRASQFARRCLL